MWTHSGLRKIWFGRGRVPENSPLGTDDPDDPMFQSTFVAVFSEFYIQNSFKTAG